MFSKEEIKKAWSLAQEYKITYFGSVGSNNKTIKSDKKTEYLTWLMYLAPYNSSGYNVCPFASKGCISGCLNTAGHGRHDNVQRARIRRTKFLFEHRKEFKICVFSELTKFIEKCKKLNKKPAVRFNGTSELPICEMFPEFLTHFKDVKFYDYVKSPITYQKFIDKKLPPNYYAIFSMSESNRDKALEFLNKGGNVAVVFKKIPQEYMGFKVINGDDHDLRIIDPPNTICGLKAKGRARTDSSGFVKKIINLNVLT